MFRNIDAEMKKKGMTRKQLAKMLDISTPTLKAWINRSTELPASQVIALSVFFDCSTDYLLTEYK